MNFNKKQFLGTDFIRTDRQILDNDYKYLSASIVPDYVNNKFGVNSILNEDIGVSTFEHTSPYMVSTQKNYLSTGIVSDFVTNKYNANSILNEYIGISAVKLTSPYMVSTQKDYLPTGIVSDLVVNEYSVNSMQNKGIGVSAVELASPYMVSTQKDYLSTGIVSDFVTNKYNANSILNEYIGISAIELTNSIIHQTQIGSLVIDNYESKWKPDFANSIVDYEDNGLLTTFEPYRINNNLDAETINELKSTLGSALSKYSGYHPIQRYSIGFESKKNVTIINIFIVQGNISGDGHHFGDNIYLQ